MSSVKTNDETLDLLDALLDVVPFIEKIHEKLLKVNATKANRAKINRAFSLVSENCVTIARLANIEHQLATKRNVDEWYNDFFAKENTVEAVSVG